MLRFGWCYAKLVSMLGLGTQQLLSLMTAPPVLALTITLQCGLIYFYLFLRHRLDGLINSDLGIANFISIMFLTWSFCTLLLSFVNYFSQCMLDRSTLQCLSITSFFSWPLSHSNTWLNYSKFFFLSALSKSYFPIGHHLF